jgi:hypothetical protein
MAGAPIVSSFIWCTHEGAESRAGLGTLRPAGSDLDDDFSIGAVRLHQPVGIRNRIELEHPLGDCMLGAGRTACPGLRYRKEHD